MTNSLQKKIILITGANAGIGKETTRALAKSGARIIMACRNLKKSTITQQEIIEESKNYNIQLIHLDLASIASIRMFTDKIHDQFSHIDILINNAGIFNMKRELTADGFEATMGVNCLGTFLLTDLLLPGLLKSKNSRIINVASDAHYNGSIDLDNFHFDKKYSGFKAYASSRLATVLYTQELAERLKDHNITVNSLHPGHVYTNIWNLWPKRKLLNMIMDNIMKRVAISAVEGAKTSIYLASSDQVAGISGKYFDKLQIKAPSKKCQDKDFQKALWDFSSKEVGL
ncbi:MAG: SDR family oxidoreductase [Anaerolineaceae bacterium]|nr:SDR family oxidoreductase [Anaerolineaceae bacterium]